MAHAHAHHLDRDITRLKPANKTLGLALMAIGLIAIVAAFFVGTTDHPAAEGVAAHTDHQRFWFAYLFGLAGVTTVSCCSLIFVLVNHLVRAGWITNVRRIMESMAIQLPLVFVLMIPILLVGLSRNGVLYSWSKPSDTPVAPEVKVATELSSSLTTYPNEQVQPGVTRAFDENVARKARIWLVPWFWALRAVVFMAVLSGIAWYYYGQSVKQDSTGDIDISANLSQMAGPLILAVGLITTFIGFDMFMSLDPKWFSTMFGVYFFASGTQAMWALMCLAVLALQARGYLKESVGVEHRHDLGKFLWAFIFFWTYIAFSQYMLQWYANLPEETFWFDKRGYSTAHPTGYSPFVLALLFGRFAIPFIGLVSRHVKRNRFGLGFWSVWLLIGFVIDMYLLVIPEESYTRLLGAPEVLGFVGITTIWGGSLLRTMASAELRPIADPRVHESMAIQNI